MSLINFRPDWLGPLSLFKWYWAIASTDPNLLRKTLTFTAEMSQYRLQANMQSTNAMHYNGVTGLSGVTRVTGVTGVTEVTGWS